MLLDSDIQVSPDRAAAPRAHLSFSHTSVEELALQNTSLKGALGKDNHLNGRNHIKPLH